jgi:hypothetical protein
MLDSEPRSCTICYLYLRQITSFAASNCITQIRPEEGTNVATYVLFRRAPSQYSASLYAVPNPILRVLALKTFLLFTVWHQLKYPLKVPGNELWLDIAPLR